MWLGLGLLLLLGRPARADLIDTGTTNDFGGHAQAVASQIFYDSAGHGIFDTPHGPQFQRGWVSLFGSLDGGVYFFTDFFEDDTRTTPTAAVWWDFTGSDTLGLLYVLVFGRSTVDNTAEERLYVVPHADRLAGAGTVTLSETVPIWSIAFYGPRVPEPGTLALLGLGLAGLALIRRRRA